MTVKKPYSCIVFSTNRPPAKFKYVSKYYELMKWAINKGYNVTAVNIYYRTTGQFKEQIKP